jgi:hypothetical protein
MVSWAKAPVNIPMGSSMKKRMMGSAYSGRICREWEQAAGAGAAGAGGGVMRRVGPEGCRLRKEKKARRLEAPGVLELRGYHRRSHGAATRAHLPLPPAALQCRPVDVVWSRGGLHAEQALHDGVQVGLQAGRRDRGRKGGAHRRLGCYSSQGVSSAQGSARLWAE